MSTRNTEDYISCCQRVYNLLRADIQHLGALAFLPAGGLECEEMVEKAVAELKAILEPDDLPQPGVQ